MVWDSWKQVYLIGTEWNLYDEAQEKIEWDFDHLQKDLNTGKFKNKTVYLFGATEPQLVDLENGDPPTVVPIPTIIAVDTSAPPSTQLGIKSVQMQEETIVPLKRLKMDWNPYTGSDITANAYFLSCNQRRTALKNLNETRLKSFEYSLLHIWRPDNEEEEQFETNVNVLVTLEGRPPLVFDFDWELDTLSDFVEEVCEDNELDVDKYGPVVKEEIKKVVIAARNKIKSIKEAKRQKLEAMDPEERSRLKEMTFTKYYPQNKVPDTSGIRSKFINRYYGKAHEVK